MQVRSSSLGSRFGRRAVRPRHHHHHVLCTALVTSQADWLPDSLSGQDLGDSVWPLLSAVIPRATSVRVRSGTITAMFVEPKSRSPACPEGSPFTPVDAVEALKRKFKISHVSEGVRFSSPSGPILLLSEKGGGEDKLLWRFRVTGNDSWSVGVILESKKDDNEELYQRGKVGLDSQGLSGGVMESHSMHGIWISVAFDCKAGVATYTLRGRSIQQTATFSGPVRLALSTFAGSIVTMSNGLEQEITSDFSEMREGARVVLASDYADYDDAGSGPLKPGDVGTIHEVDEDDPDKQYKVTAANGKKWWYHKNAVVLAGGMARDSLN